MKHAADFISLSRIVFALLMLAVRPLSAAFVLLFCLCGVSDVADGYTARKYNTVSKTGALLDSIADLIFFIVLMIVFIPMLYTYVWVMVCIGVIVAVRIAAYIAGLVKYRDSLMLHTVSNKLAGCAVFYPP